MDSEQPAGGPKAGTGTGRGTGASAGWAAGGLPERRQVAVDQFPGPHAGELVLRELAAAARESADTLHHDPPPLDRPELEWRLEADAALARRGVRVRAVYPRAALHEPLRARFLQELSDAGVIVRVIDHVAHDLMIFDRHTVCLPSCDRPARRRAFHSAPAPSAGCEHGDGFDAPGAPGSPSAHGAPGRVGATGASEPPEPAGPSLLRVRGSALVRSFTAIHESYWQRATPLPLAGTGLRHAALGEMERAVIRLMTNGYGDDRIARKLHIERQAVEDVMAALMERLGAGSRFEVGYKLARALDPSELSPGRA
ncbi:putative transcriptional regulator [Actinacidiphila reveromycinica]|uniref:Putative transcriptional regulator n=1 Tax=Actinacidiphila reveromycinica TaxID=659352 RepID=A0A7U3UPS4_9ACTN|nr:LuxR C-terminal-related transcriptional regulator [Streptomyces sp. SN-593]BBA98145.1 putative transcriptional regulator [Streptomyces sp. SN-593]